MVGAYLIRWGLLGIVLGVAGASFLVWDGAVWILPAFGVAMVAVWSDRRWSWLVLGVAIGASFGWWRMAEVSTQWQSLARDFHPYAVTDATARVVGEGTTGSFARMIPARLEDCGADACPREKVLVQAPLTDMWRPGDLVRISCGLELPRNTDESFDYRMYLAKEGIGFVCRPKSIEVVGSDPDLMERIIVARQRVEGILARAVPEPENGLLQGLIFGGSDRLSRDMRDRFAWTGLSHIVAVSGYNVTLVAEYLLWAGILVGLWRRQAFWVALAGIWLFVFVTGAEASVMRAGIMGTIGFLALQGGRLADTVWLVVMAAAGMLLANPLYLRYDTGFQLSFLATVTLVSAVGSFGRTASDTVGGQFREVVLATLAIEVVVAPLLLHDFGFVSLVSLPANALVLPVVPVAMALAFLATLAGAVVPAGLNVFAWLAYGAAAYIVAVVRFLSGLPWATISWPLPGWAVALWYGVLVLGLSVVKRRKKLFG